MDTTSKTNTTHLQEQVSFIIQHNVNPGKHLDYERWLQKIIGEAAKFKGHMGAHVARPAEGHDTYEIAVRFASREDAEHWVHSETRRDLMREAASLITEPEKLNIKSGIDYWFTSVTEGNTPPPRWKQWLTTVSVIWPLTMLVPWALRPVFKAVPFLTTFGVQQLLVAMAVVGLVVWVVMPPYTRAISKWLSR